MPKTSNQYQIQFYMHVTHEPKQFSKCLAQKTTAKSDICTQASKAKFVKK